MIYTGSAAIYLASLPVWVEWIEVLLAEAKVPLKASLYPFG